MYVYQLSQTPSKKKIYISAAKQAGSLEVNHFRTYSYKIGIGENNDTNTITQAFLQ